MPNGMSGSSSTSSSSRGGVSGNSASGSSHEGGGAVLSALLDTSLLADRNKAFELFRKSYRHNEVGGQG